MKIGIVGLGYVGFPLACAIAHNSKYEVLGVDLDENKIDLIQKKQSPVEDKRAEEDIKTVNITVSTNAKILKNSEIFLICVPTPVDHEFLPDFGPVKGACTSIAPYIKKGSIVVIESTINPGVCEEIVIPLLEEKTGMKAGQDFDVAHCPERINPGDSIWNVYNIPRNVGATTPEACKRVADFYRDVLDTDIVNEMDNLREAEATKIIENTFRDINIAYVNELAKSFDVMGIDLVKVIKGASNKPFAFMPHYPGCGVGGHCIPVDPYYLIKRASQSGFDHRFLRNAREINNSMPEYTVELLYQAIRKSDKCFKKTTIALLGLSYKANIGDLRESPALVIRELLEKEGTDLIVYDPYCPDGSTETDLETVLKKADALIVATDHKVFKNLSAKKIKDHQVSIVIDGRNCLDKSSILNAGIYYKGIGA